MSGCGAEGLDTPSEWIVSTTYDDGKVVKISYCNPCLASMMDAHVKYGYPFDDCVVEVKVQRRVCAGAS